MADLLLNTYVMNIPTSVQRLADFASDYPACLPSATVWQALTGNEVTPPSWWQASRNNYAIGVNFRNILLHEQTKNENKCVMIFEDDVVFVEDFESRYNAFLEGLAENSLEDFDMLYLGGGHVGVFLPELVTPSILRCHNIWAPHAVIVKPTAFQTIIDALSDATPWACEHRHECRLGELMQLGQLKVYAPLDQMAGQRGGIPSDNAHFTREHDEYFPRFDYVDLNHVIVSHGQSEEEA